MRVEAPNRFSATAARIAITGAIFLVATATASAAEPFRFPEGKHGKGELRYINDLPVMILEGTPEEIGEQHAVLVSESMKDVGRPRKVLARDRLPTSRKATLCQRFAS